MTILQRLGERLVPMPMSLARPTRARLEQLLDELYERVDRAEGTVRADRDRVAAMIERRATAYDLDATHLDRLGGKSPLTAEQRRAIADELRDVLRDVTGER